MKERFLAVLARNRFACGPSHRTANGQGFAPANVPGLPVYGAADTHAKAERAIRAVLEAHLQEHPASKPEARVRVARYSDAGTGGVEIVGVAALVGAKRTAAKAQASRANGRLGGRPRKAVGASTARNKA